MKHSKTAAVPFRFAFDEETSYVHYLHLFDCRAANRPVVSKLSTFANRLQDGVHLLYDKGGLFGVLTNSVIFRTKHVQFEKNEFLGLPGNYDHGVGDTATYGPAVEIFDSSLSGPQARRIQISSLLKNRYLLAHSTRKNNPLSRLPTSSQYSVSMGRA